VEQTIRDFGEQWTRYRRNRGYYASTEMLRDILEPLVPLRQLEGTSVAEIGSGTGRIVNMLLSAGVSHVVAVEPSDAVHALRENTSSAEGRVSIVHAPGEAIPLGRDFDLVLSIGVLHHVPEPAPIVQRVYDALRPGGRFAVWLYGYEGNELYLAFADPLRKVTTRLPHHFLAAMTWGLCPPLRLYAKACGVVRLPMASYMTDVIDKLSNDALRLNIYDQLNPGYAKYYRRQEAIDLLAGVFDRVEIHHRHGYSWTVVGHKRG
jgi:SAM-dependent methyltransferase